MGHHRIRPRVSLVAVRELEAQQRVVVRPAGSGVPHQRAVGIVGLLQYPVAVAIAEAYRHAQLHWPLGGSMCQLTYLALVVKQRYYALQRGIREQLIVLKVNVPGAPLWMI